jgi:membrane associated rhomboid family serine protease
MSNSPAPKPGAGGTGPAAAQGSTGPLAGQAGRSGVTGAGATRRGMWDLGAGDAEMVLAEARKALFVMVAFLAAIWIVQIANWADHYQLSIEYGIRPHDLASLPDILSAPFLHFSWAHIEGNSGPLFIFGFLAAYRG